jgi:hypothetical protein
MPIGLPDEAINHAEAEAGILADFMTKRANDWLPPPRIRHPWPDQRFAVKHPR